MKSEDKDNYGTPFSYATKSEDNEVMMSCFHVDIVNYYIMLVSLVDNNRL